jgi:hypothetical protein
MKIGSKVTVSVPTYDENCNLIKDGGKPVTMDIIGIVTAFDGFAYNVELPNGTFVKTNAVKEIKETVVEKTVETEETKGDSGPAPLESDNSPKVEEVEDEKPIKTKHNLFKKGKKK